ncbi:hypothetical protein KUCAC02_035841, partial [Chaenocephalus aceratus]
LISLEQCQASGACLVVTVFDHDTLRSDDFEGEAFLGLKAIPGVAGQMEGNALSLHPDAVPAQIRLSLMHPKPNDADPGSVRGFKMLILGLFGGFKILILGLFGGFKMLILGLFGGFKMLILGLFEGFKMLILGLFGVLRC